MKELENMKKKMEQDKKENDEIIEKLTQEATQAKVALANSSYENEDKMMELKVKIKKLTTKLESMGVKPKDIK